MYFSLAVPGGWSVPLAMLAGGVSGAGVHHFSRLRAWLVLQIAQANDVVGFISGILTFTPYYHWRWEHALHHATSGDLDRRGRATCGP